ncbi:hypothetical protein KGM_214057A, partial [Danaus plexippus plexippus]
MWRADLQWGVPPTVRLSAEAAPPVPSDCRIEVSAAVFLNVKEAQTPSNKAFGSGKTNTRHIPMLDIIRSAHTVGMTTEPSHWSPRSLLQFEL